MTGMRYCYCDICTEPDAPEEAPMPETCHWTQDADPDFAVWQTDCGEAFTLMEGGPTENTMRFCCYCGLALVPVLRPPDVLEDDDD